MGMKGWNPVLRQRVETEILESLKEHKELSCHDLRLVMRRRKMLPGNLALEHRSISSLCRSLMKRGFLDHDGINEKNLTVWKLAVKQF